MLKPAELTPLTALRFAELAAEAGLPEGVVNVVVGPGRDRRRSGSSSTPDVGKIAFTGSTEVGRSIAAGAAQTIKRVTLELGGKSANVVFADADVEAAAAAAPLARVRQRRPGLLRALADPRAGRGDGRASWPRSRPPSKALRVGDPLDEATQMGPLISAGQREAVASFLDDGAPVAFRGTAPDGPGLLVRADRARARSTRAPARRARRSSARSPR